LAEATPIAQKLDACNRERQQIERDIVDKVISSVQGKFNPDNDFVIVEGDSSWHIGVVGIVASRVLQQFYRPTIILGGDGAQWRGSGRSIAGFDLAGALRECGNFLIRHGGHAMAAGLSLDSTNLVSFRSRLNELARSNLQPELLQAPLHLDAEVGLEEMTFHCLSALERLKPLGQGNPSTQFVARNLTQQRPHQRLGPDKQHVKMWLSDGGMTHQAMWFSAKDALLPDGPFDLAFAPQFNDYNGFRQIQLRVLDWNPAPNSNRVTQQVTA